MTYMCKQSEDQDLIVLNLHSITINKTLATTFMTVKVSHNLNLMEQTPTQWNQQLSKYIFSKVIECLQKSNTRMNTTYSKNKSQIYKVLF